MRRKDDEKEQRIRNAVIEVVLEEGFGGASIAKIARRAGVSPATVYIYHENKETMLQSIYLEGSEELYDYLLSGLTDWEVMDGGWIIERLIRGYFDFMVDHGNLLGFITQFSSCPALVHKCSDIQSLERMKYILQQCIETGVFCPCEVMNAFGLIMNPVKMLAAGRVAAEREHCACGAQVEEYTEELLRELITIIQRALLP